MSNGELNYKNGKAKVAPAESDSSAAAAGGRAGGDLDKLREFYQSKWADHPRAKVVPEGRSVFEIAKTIRPEMVADAGGAGGGKKWVVENTWMGRHVPYGHLSVGTEFGNPKIWPEGYYARAGVGRKFGNLVRLNTRVITSERNILTIINLKENEVAIVVNTTDTQVCYGPSQYVLLEPWGQAGGVVDLMQLQRTNYEFQYDGSIRALAFHVPKGEVAIIQVNDEKDSLRVFGSGHHVVADGGARFIGFIDTRDTEMTRNVVVRIRNGNQITWPVTMSLQIVDPIAFFISKRKSALDVIDEALTQSVAQFCATLDLNQIRGTAALGERSIYSMLADVINNDENVNGLASKYGVVVKNVVIGTYKLDSNAEKAIEASAKEELSLQNDLRQAELKMRSAEANFRVDNKTRELQKKKIEEENGLALLQATKCADVAEQQQQRKLELNRRAREEQAALCILEAEAEANAQLKKAQAEVEAKRLEFELIKETRAVLGDAYVNDKMRMEIRGRTVEKTFANTEKMVVDPRLGMRHVMSFVDDELAGAPPGGVPAAAVAKR